MAPHPIETHEHSETVDMNLVVGRGDSTAGEIDLETVWIWACRCRLSKPTYPIELLKNRLRE